MKSKMTDDEFIKQLSERQKQTVLLRFRVGRGANADEVEINVTPEERERLDRLAKKYAMRIGQLFSMVPTPSGEVRKVRKPIHTL